MAETTPGVQQASTPERSTAPRHENVFFKRNARIIPDVHGGSIDTLLTRPVRDEFIVALGDIMDRGVDSAKAARQMMEIVKKGEGVWNLGNHDLLFMATMMDSADSTKAASSANIFAFGTWFLNGGMETARGFGVDVSGIEAKLNELKANGVPEGDLMWKFLNESMASTEVAHVINGVRTNKELRELSDFLQQNGKMYTIIDNVVATHAGFLADSATGRLKDVVIEGQSYGKGFDAMDKIQAEVRKGNTQVIGWLSNHGGSSKLNRDNPLWVREEGYQDVLRNPGLAHNLRADLDEQAKARGALAELIVVGHTPKMGDTTAKTQPLADAPERYLFADKGFHEAHGEPRVVKLRVSNEARDKVTVIYQNPVTGISQGVSKRYEVGAVFAPPIKEVTPAVAPVQPVEAATPGNIALGPTLQEIANGGETLPTGEQLAQWQSNLGGLLRGNLGERNQHEIRLALRSLLYGKEGIQWPGELRIYDAYSAGKSVAFEQIINGKYLATHKTGADSEADMAYGLRSSDKYGVEITDAGNISVSVPAEALAMTRARIEMGEILTEMARKVKTHTPITPEDRVTLEAASQKFIHESLAYWKGKGAEPSVPVEAKQVPQPPAAAKEGETSQPATASKEPEKPTMTERPRINGTAHFVDMPQGSGEGVAIADVQTAKVLAEESQLIEQFLKDGANAALLQQAFGGNTDKTSLLEEMVDVMRYRGSYAALPVEDPRRAVFLAMEKANLFGKGDEYAPLGGKPLLQAAEARLNILLKAAGNSAAQEIIPDKRFMMHGEVAPRKPAEAEPVASPEQEPTPAVPVQPDNLPAPQPTTPPKPLETSANVGLAAVSNASVQNILQIADHVGAQDIARMKKPWYTKIPILGGIAYSMRHPVKMIWQQNLARSVFEQQRVRFAADFRNIVKSAADQTVPVEVSAQLVDVALAEGRAMLKSSGLLKRMRWGIGDYISGITGIGQTSEMRFAQKWLKNEMASRRDTWHAQLTQSTGTILPEQTRLGERFALKPDSLTLEQANAHVLSYKGETRRSLMKDVGEASANKVNRRLREIVENYATKIPAMTKEELVAEVNTYFKSSEFILLLPKEQRHLIQASELASNIIPVADMVKSRWTEYAAPPVGAETGRVFDTFTFNILYGKAEWGGVRGRTETSFITEKLARRLTERKFSAGSLGYSASLANDLITYGGAYLAGYGASTLNTVFNKLPSALLTAGVGPIGGVLGMGVMSAVKETGFSVPWLGRRVHFNVGGHEFHPLTYVGRTAKEAGQASREAARGALEGAKGSIRAEIERTLVARKDAVTLTNDINALLSAGEGQMSEQQAMALLTTLADVDARMRLSDLSGSAQMNYKTQNYIGFAAGKENEQYLALKSALLNGIVQLNVYGATNKPFMKGHGDMFTGSRASVGQMGLFEKMSSLAEAQLRHSSDVEVVSQWMRRDLGMSQTEVDQLIKDFFGEQKIVSKTAESESLSTKEWNLRKLSARRGAAILIKSALAAPIAGYVYQGVTNVVGTGISEVSDLIREGPQKWAGDWGGVLDRNLIVKIDDSGHIASSLTPMQQGYLAARSMIEPPAEFSSTHTATIDGIDIALPGHMKYWDDGKGHDGIIDLRNGSVVRDLSGIEVHGQVVGGQSVMVYTDAAGNRVDGDPIADFRQIGVDIKPLAPLLETRTTPAPAVSHTESNMTIEHREVIDAGTEWDKSSGRYGFTFAHGSQHAMQDYKDTNAAGEAVYIVHAGGGTTTTPDGTTYNIAQAAANHQVGFAIQIPGHGTILVPPNQGDNNELRLDPSDTTTFKLANGSDMTYGELAKLVINQDELKKQTDGFLGTEWKHHTDVLALKPEGRQWGSISSVIVPHGTVTDPQEYTYNGHTVNTNGMITASGQRMDGSLIAFAAVRGTAPAGEHPIEVVTQTVHSTPVEPVESTISEQVRIPAFESTIIPEVPYVDIPLLAMPMGRVNIEKAEYGAAPEGQGSSVTPPTTGAVAQSTKTVNETGLTQVSEAEKKAVEELLKAIGVQVTPNERKDKGKSIQEKVKKFDEIYAEALLYRTAYASQDAAALTKRKEALRKILEKNWRIKKGEIEAKLAQIDIQLQRELEQKAAKKAAEEAEAQRVKMEDEHKKQMDELQQSALEQQEELIRAAQAAIAATGANNENQMAALQERIAAAAAGGGNQVNATAASTASQTSTLNEAPEDETATVAEQGRISARYGES